MRPVALGPNTCDADRSRWSTDRRSVSVPLVVARGDWFHVALRPSMRAESTFCEVSVVPTPRTFQTDPARDAFATIRGFVYQIERTIMAWIDLPEGVVLHCEAGEDIDYVRQFFGGGNRTVEDARLLEQVKHLEKSISLRTPMVRESIANYLEARARNPGMELRFRLFTNAAVARERSSPLADRQTGIAAWMSIHDGTLVGERRVATLAGLRRLLLPTPAKRQSRLTGEQVPDTAIASFLATAADDTLVADLIARFAFSTGNISASESRLQIERQLLARSLARTELEARQLYEALFSAVFARLSRSGDKRLDRATLHAVAEGGTLAAVDRAVLGRIERYLDTLQARLDAMQQELAAIARNTAPAQISASWRSAAELIGLPQAVSAFMLTQGSQAIPDMPPMLPAFFASRTKLRDTIANAFSTRRWIALTGLAGIGKTYVARDVFDGRTGGSARWVRLHGRAQDAAQHLREQLYLWLRDLRGDDHDAAAWLAAQAPLETLFREIVARCQGRYLLVLDDLPDPASDPQVLDSLIAVGGVLRDTQGHVLSTCQHPLPTTLLNMLGTAAYELRVPTLDEREIAALLSTANAPARGSLTRLMLDLTRGHPALVAAALHWLIEHNWAIGDEQFRRLLLGEPLFQPRQDARRQVRTLIADAQSRLLLDRLSLVGADFGTPTVTAVGGVSPAVTRPGECLHDLVGPWIERLDERRYEISPLLQDVGGDYLDAAEQRDVHRAVAEVALAARTIDATKAWWLLSHLIAAEAWDTVITVFIELARAIDTPALARALGWAARLFGPEARWPEGLPTDRRVVIRALQIRLLVLGGVEVAWYERDLEQLIARLGESPQERRVIGFARLQAGVLRTDLPAPVIARRAHEAAIALRGGDGVDSSTTLPPEALIWAAVSRARGVDDVRAVTAVLRSMSPEGRRSALAHPPHPAMYILLADRCRRTDVDSADAIDADTSLAALGELADLGREAAVPALVAAAARTRAATLADQRGDIEGALALLRSVPRDEPVPHFIAAWSSGRIMLVSGRTAESFPELASAIACANSVDVAGYHSEALADGVLAAVATAHWPEAKHWAGRAIRMTRARLASGPGGPLEPIKILAELAWARWREGARTQACGAMYGAVRWLLAVPDRTAPMFVGLMVRVTYALQWLASVVTTGGPPPTGSDGVPYSAPMYGFFFHAPPRATTELPTAPGLEATCWQLGKFATAVGCERIARWAFVHSAAEARLAGLARAAGFADSERCAIECYLGDFVAARDAALAGAMAIAVTRHDPRDDALKRRGDVAHDWREVPETGQEEALQVQLFTGIVCPILARLLSESEEGDRAERDLDRLEAAFADAIPSIAIESLWRQLVAGLRLIAASATLAEEVRALLTDLGDGNPYERIVLLVALARAKGTSPGEIVEVQMQILVLLFHDPGALADFIRVRFSAWVIGHWSAEAARGFRLATPVVLRQELAGISPTSNSLADAARVLLAAATAAKIAIRGDAAVFLRAMASPAGM